MEIEVRGEKRTKAMSTPSGSKEERRGEAKGKSKSRKEAIVTATIIPIAATTKYRQDYFVYILGVVLLISMETWTSFLLRVSGM